MSYLDQPVEDQIAGPHHYRNNAKAIAISNQNWQKAKENGLTHIRVKFMERDEHYHVVDTGHEFINICSCSYLGLNSHPLVLQGAIDAVKNEQVLHLAMSTLRISLDLKRQVEDELSELFRASTLQVLSASVGIAGLLPIVASGHLAEGKPMVMIFDRFCHFSMAYMKPACADETLVLTCPNNDLDFIEDACKKYPRVAYVTDGVYSMGGLPTLPGLLELQEKYGLFLFFDDSHSISIRGEQGEGYIRSSLKELTERTVIVGSLGKGFGANGGAILLGSEKHADIIRRYGGPIGWSQDMNVAGLGAVSASIKIHRTPELKTLQDKLRENIDFFDSQIETEYSGNTFPIRIVTFGEEDVAIRAASEMFKRGFYTSAVYFPIVARGKAGIRVMIRANLTREDIIRICEALKEVLALLTDETEN